MATLVAYQVVLVVIGFLAQRRTRDGEDYFLAGRRLGPIVAAISASASSSSAWTLLGVSGMAYSSGLSALWLFPACVGGFCLNWFVLAPALGRVSRERGALTVTEVLAGFGTMGQRRHIKLVASILVLLALLTYVASQFQGAGKAFANTFPDLDFEAAVLLGSAIVVLYTLLGGFWAASLTDTLQGFVMAATAVVLPIGVLAHVGFADFFARLEAVDVPGYTSLVGPRSGFAAALGFVAGLLGIGLGYPGQPHVVNRFMALREGARELRVARRVAIGWAVVVYAGMILLGLGARLAFPVLDDGENAFTTVANRLFPPMVSGVMVAAVLSAVMSTADSQLLVAASTITSDLGFSGGSQQKLLAQSRWVVLVLSACAVLAALFVEQKIFDLVLFAWSAMGAAFGPLLLVVCLRGPVSYRGTLASMTAGFSLSVGAYVLGKLGFVGAMGLGAWGGTLERVLPFVVALAIAVSCRKPK